VKRDDEAEVLPECKRLDVAYLPYFPLASGALTGKYRKGQPTPEGARLHGHPRADRWLNDANMDKVEDLIAFAKGQGHTILELAFSWLLMREPVASVIAGATKPEQIHGNAAAAGWQLSADEMAQVDTILKS
jgi:aryl-alcohol dehydrogenase-like predicted oxidoreductase